MKISVIIPSYNSERYIFSAIESVLSQSYQDFEIIVVDDGSKDNTRKIVKSFKDPRIIYIYQENSGPAIARNTALNIAKGEYVAFLDADDTWLPIKLETQLDIIKDQKDTCMVYSSFICTFEGKNNIQRVNFNNYIRQGFIKNLLIRPFETIPYPSTVLIKKSYLDEVGYFNPDLCLGEDWDLWLRLATKAECKYVNEPLAVRYIPRSSITRSINIKEQKYYHIKILQDFFDKNPEYKNLKAKAYSEIYYNLAKHYFYRNNKIPTQDVYLSLLRTYKLNPWIAFTKIQNLKFLFNVAFRTFIKDKRT